MYPLRMMRMPIVLERMWEMAGCALSITVISLSLVACPGPCPDTDGDGTCDAADPCPADAADDSDGDGSCDSDDRCIGSDPAGDTDGDGTCDDEDPCPEDNPDDADGDGFCDSDPCAEDNGGCGPPAYYECRDTGGAEAECSPLVDVVEYAPDPGSLAPWQYRMLFVLVNTTGEIPETSQPTPGGVQEYYTPTELGDVFFQHPDGVASFMEEASYGQVALSGTVVGWFHEGDLGLSDEDLFNNRDAYFDLACWAVDCSQYDIFVLVGRAETGGRQTGWLMQNTVTTSHGVFSQVGILFMINSPFLYPAGSAYTASVILPSKYYAHELSHTLGSTGHANSLWCGDATGDETLGASCQQRAYGSVFSLMGNCAFATHHHFTTKQALGWLQPSQVHEIDLAGPFTSGDYTIYPIETDDGLPKGITLRLSSPVSAAGQLLDRLHVEYRTAAGFDRWLTRLDGPDAPDGGAFLARYTPLTDIDREGVVLYLDSSADGVETLWLLDAHPGTAFDPNSSIYSFGNPGKFADAILNIGETLDLPALEVTLTPTGLTAGPGITVTVTAR
jgi:hypothetical protein